MGSPSITEYRPDGVVVVIKADDRTPEEKQAPLLASLANRRWQATQSFTFDGVETAADGAAMAITGALLAMQLGGPDTVNWKLADGEWRTWGFTDLLAFGQSVSAHIQACFDHEAALAALIGDGQEPNIEAGWPGEG